MNILRYHAAAVPAVAVETVEEERLETELLESCDHGVWRTSAGGQLFNLRAATAISSDGGFNRAFAQIADEPDTLLVVHDFQHVVKNAAAYRQLKDILPRLKMGGSMVVLLCLLRRSQAASCFRFGRSAPAPPHLPRLRT